MNILDAVAEFERLALAVGIQSKADMDAAAKIIQDEAKAMIGEYQTGIAPFKDWPQLAARTMDDKMLGGYAPPDNPLLRTGEMRDSIERDADIGHAVVGSNDDVAVWQELGTHGPNPGGDGYHVPPRSFLGGAAMRKGEDAALAIGAGLERAIVGTAGRMLLP